MGIHAKRLALALALMLSAAAGGTSAQTTTTYTYDPLGRVATSTNTASNLQTTYSYDAADNRSNVTVAPPGSGGGGNPPNGVSCTTGSGNIQAHQSGTVKTTFNPVSQCTDSTSGATMGLSTWSVSGAGTGSLTAPGTITLTLSVGTTTVSYTVIDNQGGSASSTFVFNRTS